MLFLTRNIANKSINNEKSTAFAMLQFIFFCYAKKNNATAIANCPA